MCVLRVAGCAMFAAALLAGAVASAQTLKVTSPNGGNNGCASVTWTATLPVPDGEISLQIKKSRKGPIVRATVPPDGP